MAKQQFFQGSGSPNLSFPLHANAKTYLELLDGVVPQKKTLEKVISSFKDKERINLFDLIKKYNKKVSVNISRSKAKGKNQLSMTFGTPESQYHSQLKKGEEKIQVDENWMKYYKQVLNQNPNRFAYALNVLGSIIKNKGKLSKNQKIIVENAGRGIVGV